MLHEYITNILPTYLLKNNILLHTDQRLYTNAIIDLITVFITCLLINSPIRDTAKHHESFGVFWPIDCLHNSLGLILVDAS